MKSTQTFRSQLGFTLTELAIVLVIVALLIGGMLVPLSSQRDIQSTNETARQLAEIKEALLGFAAAHGRLPCPDTNSDGAEDIAAPLTANGIPLAGQSTQTFSGCVSEEDDFPFDTVGTSRQDSWGHRFRYRVKLSFTQSVVVWSDINATGSILSVTPGFTLSTTGNISIKTRGDDPSTPVPNVEAKFISNLATGIPAVIISHGKNGYGAKTADGLALPGPPTANVDEITNLKTTSTTKIARFSTQVATACSDTTEGSPFCEFDDLVTWISPNILYNRMISAGRLP